MFSKGLNLRFALAAALAQRLGDFAPAAENAVQAQGRRDGGLDLMKRELKLTPVAAWSRLLQGRGSPRGKSRGRLVRVFG